MFKNLGEIVTLYIGKQGLFLKKDIVGKRGHTPPLSKIPPFLEIQDVPTLIGLSGKQKY